jgi:hypothetical protein
MRNNSIDITSLFLQIYNLILLLQDFNNADLMRELQKISSQNDEILRILNERREIKCTKE